MKRKIFFLMRVLVLVLVAPVGGALAEAQNLSAPSPVEKALAARAANVSEVTLNKNMLGFAAKFMNRKEDAEVKQLIDGLDGIYIRNYEFDKPGEYAPEEVERLRASLTGGDWMPLVRERDRKSGESSDVMIRMVNGESHGLFVLSAEKKEVSVVLILGKIRMEDLGKLKGLSGVGGALGAVSHTAHEKAKSGGAR